MITSLLYQDADIMAALKANPKARILIITPYKAQVKLLNESVLTKKGRQRSIEVSTVDAFQGQEADIVVLSMVRTQRVGFIDDQCRINVAMTRAKRILRVVGDLQFFRRQPKESILNELARFSEANNWSIITSIQPDAWSPPNWSDPDLL